MLGLTQRSLVQRSLRLKRGVLGRASCFPMFAGDGRVESLLLIDHQAVELYLVEWRPGVFQKAWFAAPTLVLDPEELDGCRLREVPDLEGLWHFDPWWLLAEEKFSGLEVTPSLKQTNCVAQAPNLCTVTYNRNLFSVSSVMVSKQSGEVQFTNLRALELPEANGCPELSGGRGEQRGWALHPFWVTPRGKRSLAKQKALI